MINKLQPAVHGSQQAS